MKIVTGVGEGPHVTSKEMRRIVECMAGRESYVIDCGDQLRPELVSNNLLKIHSGAMIHHGNVSSVDPYDEIEITNGTQGMKRIDLIVNRYTKNAETQIETCEWLVIQGVPAESNPEVPGHISGNLQEGDLVDDCPYIQILLDGINVTEVETLLNVVPNIPDLVAENLERKNEIAQLNGKISKIGEWEHIGTYIATSTVTTGNLLHSVQRYKKLVFISYDGNLQNGFFEVLTRMFCEGLEVELHARSLSSYNAAISIGYNSDTTIKFSIREIIGWNNCGFRVYGVL